MEQQQKEKELSELKKTSEETVEYLKKMMKASKISSKMSLKLGNDYPMKVEFSGDKVKIEFEGIGSMTLDVVQGSGGRAAFFDNPA